MKMDNPAQWLTMMVALTVSNIMTMTTKKEYHQRDYYHNNYHHHRQWWDHQIPIKSMIPAYFLVASAKTGTPNTTTALSRLTNHYTSSIDVNINVKFRWTCQTSNTREALVAPSSDRNSLRDNVSQQSSWTKRSQLCGVFSSIYSDWYWTLVSQQDITNATLCETQERQLRYDNQSKIGQYAITTAQKTSKKEWLQ